MLKDFWYALCTTCRPARSRTVRFAFPVVIATALFMSYAAALTTQVSYITIETDPASVKEGDIFFINVTATVHTPVNAIDIRLTYPETQVEVVGIDTGESVITLWTHEPYAKDGIIYLSGGTFQRGFVGEHLIARVRAKAVETGTAHVTTESARLIAGDGSGTEVAVSESKGAKSTKVYITNEDGTLVGEASIYIVTDIDGDGDVDLKDISAFMSAWFNRTGVFDFNGDGRMTFRDFSILLADSFFN